MQTAGQFPSFVRDPEGNFLARFVVAAGSGEHLTTKARLGIRVAFESLLESVHLHRNSAVVNTHTFSLSTNMSQNPAGPVAPPPGRTFTPGADPRRCWHGHDRVLTRLRFKDLKRHGYVDFGPTGSTVTPSVYPAAQAHLPDDHPHKPMDETSQEIHRALEARLWSNITMADYSLLVPSLLLASKLMSDPTVLPFFQGLNNRPMTRVDNAHTRMQTGDPLYAFSPIIPRKPDGSIHESAYLPVYRLMQKMDTCLKWTFGPVPEKALGCTTPMDGRNNTSKVVGLVPG